MSTNTIIEGLKIHLREEHTEDADIGLYSNSSNMASDSASGQKDIDVADGSGFCVGDTVTITDDNNSESGVIDSISTNTLTLKSNLQKSFTTADNGYVNATQFRWIEAPMVGTSVVWKSGIIVYDGLDPIVEGGDFVRGGGVSDLHDYGFRITNTNQFYNWLVFVILNP